MAGLPGGHIKDSFSRYFLPLVALLKSWCSSIIRFEPFLHAVDWVTVLLVLLSVALSTVPAFLFLFRAVGGIFERVVLESREGIGLVSCLSLTRRLVVADSCLKLC